MAVYNVRKTQLATISLHHARENNTDLLTLDRITYGYFRFYQNCAISLTSLFYKLSCMFDSLPQRFCECVI